MPPYPGITSAIGLLTTDLKYDAIRTQFQVSTRLDLDRLNTDLAEMEAALSQQFAEDHVAASEVSFKCSGDLRYVGQGYELKIALPDGTIDPQGLAKVWSDFHAAHQAEYGHRFEVSPIEIVNIGVSGVGVMPKLRAPRAPVGGSLEKATVRTGRCLFRVGGELKPFDTVFLQRKLLPTGKRFSGPAIILQKDSTTVVPPGASAIVDPSNNILIALSEAA